MISKSLQGILMHHLEINRIKNEILKPVLQECNKQMSENSFIESAITKHEPDTKKYIVNNNNKYYLLVFPHKQYSMLYFFKNTGAGTRMVKKAPGLDSLVPSEDSFSIEIDPLECFPKKHYLFEGYMYSKNNIMHYLFTDVLYVDKPVNGDYRVRYNLLNEIFIKHLSGIKMLNMTITLGIHHILSSRELIPIFQDNFIFNETLNCIEIVDNMGIKTRQLYKPGRKEPCEKIITKGKYADVYNVQNLVTRNNEGILYIKTLAISSHMKQLFSKQTSNVLLCEYNDLFRKWAPRAGTVE